MKPGSMTARLLAVCCAEPMTLAALVWRVDRAAHFDATSWDNALRELSKRRFVAKAMPVSSPRRWVITRAGEDMLDRLWAEQHGRAS